MYKVLCLKFFSVKMFMSEKKISFTNLFKNKKCILEMDEAFRIIPNL